MCVCVCVRVRTCVCVCVVCVCVCLYCSTVEASSVYNDALDMSECTVNDLVLRTFCKFFHLNF